MVARHWQNHEEVNVFQDAQNADFNSGADVFFHRQIKGLTLGQLENYEFRETVIEDKHVIGGLVSRVDLGQQHRQIEQHSPIQPKENSSAVAGPLGYGAETVGQLGYFLQLYMQDEDDQFGIVFVELVFKQVYVLDKYSGNDYQGEFELQRDLGSTDVHQLS